MTEDHLQRRIDECKAELDDLFESLHDGKLPERYAYLRTRVTDKPMEMHYAGAWARWSESTSMPAVCMGVAHVSDPNALRAFADWILRSAAWIEWNDTRQGD